MEIRTGSCVRVREDVDATCAAGGEIGTVSCFSGDSSSCLVELRSPTRSVWILRGHLEAQMQTSATAAAQRAPAATQTQPPLGRCEAGVFDVTAAEQDDQEPAPGSEDVCRFCLEAGDEPLERACACRGSAAWVHSTCLRSWQQFVMVSTNNRPENVVNEQRHTRCSVCHQEFAESLQPPSRSDALSRWARLRASDLTAGVLLRYASEYPVPDFEEGHECLRHIFEERKEHFRNSVYVVTEYSDTTASTAGGEVEIKGVNLCRPAISRWDTVTLEELSRGAISDEDVARLRRSGIDVSVGLGGPQQSKSLSYGIVISAEQPDGYAIGAAQEMLDLAVELNRTGRGPVGLRLFLGHARWTGEQLLGEITRQSWGFLLDGALASDLQPSTRKLWRLLEDEGRLTWAPDNPLAEEYRGRIQTSRRA